MGNTVVVDEQLMRQQEAKIRELEQKNQKLKEHNQEHLDALEEYEHNEYTMRHNMKQMEERINELKKENESDEKTIKDYVISVPDEQNNLLNNIYTVSYTISPTDENGNNLHFYSLEEVQTKLQKLKNWLKEYIMPLSTDIVDLTGSGKIPVRMYRNHDSSNNIKKIKTEKKSHVINFNYISTLSFNTNYLVNIDFYTVSEFVPDHFEVIIKTYYKDENEKLIPVQYHKLFKTDLTNSTNVLLENICFKPFIGFNLFSLGFIISGLNRNPNCK